MDHFLCPLDEGVISFKGGILSINPQTNTATQCSGAQGPCGFVVGCWTIYIGLFLKDWLQLYTLCRDTIRKMEATRCGRQGSQVTKTNSLFGSGSVSATSPFPHIPSECRQLIHYSCSFPLALFWCRTNKGPVSGTAVLSSAITFNQPVSLIYYFPSSSGPPDFTTLSLWQRFETPSPLVLGSADRKMRGPK